MSLRSEPTGDFEDLYPGIYPGYQWTYDISQPFGETNPLYQVTVVIVGTTGKRKTSQTSASVLMYSQQPASNFRRLGR